jgi:REP element-mobilizing transposase RayT
LGGHACNAGSLAGAIAGTENFPPQPPLTPVFYRRRLPHWQPEGSPVFLTWHLAGTLPPNRYPPPSAASAGKAFAWMDRCLDTTRTGPQYLRNAALAAFVMESILHGQKPLQHYQLGAFVVMPNHVHLLIVPRVPIPTLTQRLKSYTAHEANRMLCRTGEAFWQSESYDHWVRDDHEWNRIVSYIENNPVNAGLAAKPEDYPWSSATRRS